MHGFESLDVGSMFGQIGATGRKVTGRGDVGRNFTKMAKFRKFCMDKKGGFWENLGSNIYGGYPGSSASHYRFRRGKAPLFADVFRNIQVARGEITDRGVKQLIWGGDVGTFRAIIFSDNEDCHSAIRILLGAAARYHMIRRNIMERPMDATRIIVPRFLV